MTHILKLLLISVGQNTGHTSLQGMCQGPWHGRPSGSLIRNGCSLWSGRAHTACEGSRTQRKTPWNDRDLSQTVTEVTRWTRLDRTEKEAPEQTGHTPRDRTCRLPMAVWLLQREDESNFRKQRTLQFFSVQLCKVHYIDFVPCLSLKVMLKTSQQYPSALH